VEPAENEEGKKKRRKEKIGFRDRKVRINNIIHLDT